MRPLATLVTALVLGLALPAAAQEKMWTELPEAQRSKPVSGTVEMGTFATLAESLSSSVVHIDITRKVTVPRQFGLSPYDLQSGLGTGFIIREDGYILTNDHVVSGANKIRVRMVDDREFEATLVGTYPLVDLALLKIEADRPLPVVPLGDSDELRTGEWVIAIGNPFGLDHTVTAGIVSAKGRKEIAPGNQPVYSNFIQTDASINPGNSGGPLFNMRGEVVGINTAITSSGQGIGFAIPVNMAKELLPQLATGKVDQAYLGVVPQEVTRQIADALGLEKPHGALVAQVQAGSPAAEAGLQPGDIIERFNGREVEDWSDLFWLAATAGIGNKVEVDVLRSGKAQRFSVAMVARPDERSTAKKASELRSDDPDAVEIPGIGLSVAPVTKEERKARKLPAKRGVKVVALDPRGPAAQAGIRVGDYILQFGYAAVQSPKSLARMVDKARPNAAISLHVQRKTTEYFVSMRKQ